MIEINELVIRMEQEVDSIAWRAYKVFCAKIDRTTRFPKDQEFDTAL